MRELARRISHIEATQRHKRAEGHWIPVLFSPWDLPDERRDDWLAAQLACDCSPECPGKRAGALLPEKASSPEAWAERYQQYARERTSHGR
jgi:hypothetical protein